MAINRKTYRQYWLSAASLAALSLCVVAAPLSSAKAFIGVDIGGVGIGVDGPVYGYGYYPYAPAYSYGPAYYGPSYYYGGPTYDYTAPSGYHDGGY